MVLDYVNKKECDDTRVWKQIVDVDGLTDHIVLVQLSDSPESQLTYMYV